MLGRRHTRAEYLAVMLITAGVALFSLKPDTIGEALGKGKSDDAENRLVGLALVRSLLLLAEYGMYFSLFFVRLMLVCWADDRKRYTATIPRHRAVQQSGHGLSRSWKVEV